LDAGGDSGSRGSRVRRSAGMVPWTGDSATLERLAMDPEFGIEEAP
jgi:hypothetical protein